MLDNGGQLKVAGFGLIRLSKMSQDKAKLAHPVVIDYSSKSSFNDQDSLPYWILISSSLKFITYFRGDLYFISKSGLFYCNLEYLFGHIVSPCRLVLSTRNLQQ